MKPKKKKCKAKGCSVRFVQINCFHRACCPKCAVAVINQKNAEKAKADKKRDKLKLEALRPRSFFIKKAQTAFNKYVRLRDKDEPCISCRRHHEGQYHAGHYQSTGSSPDLRFHPFNNNKQCSPCNNYLSGNLVDYRFYLIKKIGLENVEYLERTKHFKQISIDDIKEIEQHYKDLYKELNKA